MRGNNARLAYDFFRFLRRPQEEVAADVALTMACPVARQGVIEPFRRQRPVVGDQQRHGLFQPVHVVPAGMRQALPVLEEVLGVV